MTGTKKTPRKTKRRKKVATPEEQKDAKVFSLVERIKREGRAAMSDPEHGDGFSMFKRRHELLCSVTGELLRMMLDVSVDRFFFDSIFVALYEGENEVGHMPLPLFLDAVAHDYPHDDMDCWAEANRAEVVLVEVEDDLWTEAGEGGHHEDSDR
jgi:hypothetical protein